MTAPDGGYPSEEVRKFDEMMRDLGGLVNASDDTLSAIFTETNDWAFVVKMCALVETALSQLITNASDDAHLIPLLEALSKEFLTRKIKYVSKMGLLTRQSVSTATGLSQIRNLLVHSIDRLDFSLAAHLAAHPNNLHEFVQSFGRLEVPHNQVEYDAAREIAVTDPHLLMRYGVVRVLTEVYKAKTNVTATVAQRRIKNDFADRLLKEWKEDADQ